jgi:DNA helicase HerA-like ATPase
VLFIGRNLEDDSDAYIDVSKSRAVVICGKRGSGKSYTMGVLIEELFRENDVVTLVVDPMGIFHTMVLPNYEQERMLWDWGASPEGFPLKVLVPGDPVARYGDSEIVQRLEERGILFEQLRLNPSDIPPEAWCDLFDFNINEPLGIALYRAIRKCKKKYGTDFFIPQIIDVLELDSRAAPKTIDALINRLDMAQEWGFFEETRYREVWELLDPHMVNILDLSTIASGRYGQRPLILSVLTRDLFRKRSIARRREELGLEAGMRKVWMLIDEAHQFVPSGKSTLCKETLVQWVKEGRQPGLSLVVVSQQPSALDMEVLSQCDVVISHALTTAVDKAALNRLTKDYMGAELRVFIDKIARTGQAVFVDDDVERVTMAQIKPRKSKPGGSEA